jgi:hypothetical protein
VGSLEKWRSQRFVLPLDQVRFGFQSRVPLGFLVAGNERESLGPIPVAKPGRLQGSIGSPFGKTAFLEPLVAGRELLVCLDIVHVELANSFPGLARAFEIPEFVLRLADEAKTLDLPGLTNYLTEQSE